MTSARKLVITVPKIAGSAPKDSVTGFQFTPDKKAGPKCVTAGHACWRRMAMIRTRTTGAVVATTAVTVRNRSGTRLTRGMETGLVSTAAAKLGRLGRFGRRVFAVQAVADASNRHDLERRDARELLAQPPNVD